ncbi:hypothetical protein CMK11_02495 [Candidatus Poribacteria bacterium]|nr:hypothetical protein [Candidatus Poribacteria bacterium]
MESPRRTRRAIAITAAAFALCVTAAGMPPQGLTVSIAADPPSGAAVLPVTFRATVGGVTGGAPLVLWDFNDADGIQVDGFGDSISHPFGHAGTYVVTATAWDDAGASGAATTTVRVEAGTYALAAPIEVRNSSFPVDDPLVIEGLEFAAAEQWGVLLDNVENVVVRDNWFHDCVSGLMPIEVVGDSRGITIERNLFEDNNGGILAPCKDVTVGYNVLERTSYVWGQWSPAIYLAGGSGTENVLVEGNVVRNTGPTYEYDRRDVTEFITAIGPIAVGGINCVIRGNLVVEALAGIAGHGDLPTIGEYARDIVIERNVIRNSFPWVEPGISLDLVSGGRMANNYVNMAWREAMRSSSSHDIVIEDNVLLGHILLLDTDRTTVRHNTVVFDPNAATEGPPYVAPANTFGIVGGDSYVDSIQSQGDWHAIEDMAVTDNLVSGTHEGIRLTEVPNARVDRNAIAYWEPDGYAGNRGVYIRVLDHTDTARVGSGNAIVHPTFADPEAGAYLPVGDERTMTMAGDGGPVGARLGAPARVSAPITEPAYEGAEALRNGGGEDSVADPWWLHTSAVAEGQVRSVASADFDGVTVLPHSGDRFLLATATVEAIDGWGMAAQYQERRRLHGNRDDIDAGSAVFRLDGYYWSRNVDPPPGIMPDIDFFDSAGQNIYTATGHGFELAAAGGGWNRLTFQGQTPPGARSANVRIMASFGGHVGVYDVAFAMDDVSLRILTEHAPDSGPTTIWDASLHAGINLLHVPVRPSGLTRVGDLFAMLGGQESVSVIVWLNDSGRFVAFTPNTDMASPASGVLADHMATLVFMNRSTVVRLTGTAPSPDVPLRRGLNMIGVPRSHDVATLSELIAKSDAIARVIREDGGRFIAAPPDDYVVLGGRGLIVMANRDATLTFDGYPWDSDVRATPHSDPSTTGTWTPVLVVEGIADDDLALRFEVAETGDVASPDRPRGRFAVVLANIARGYAAGDTLTIGAAGLGTSTALRRVLTTEDVRLARVNLGTLTAAMLSRSPGLMQNYPNPFNPETWIPFRLAEPSEVRITIYDVAGRRVKEWDMGRLDAGSYATREGAAYWDGRNADGEGAGSGVYLYRLDAGAVNETGRMVLRK